MEAALEMATSLVELGVAVRKRPTTASSKKEEA